MAYTIETLARLAGINEATARDRLRQLGISPNIMDRYSDRDLERVKGFSDPRAASMVTTRFVLVGVAATRLGVRPDEVQRLIREGFLAGGEWDSGRRCFLTVSSPSVEAYAARQRWEASQEAPGAAEDCPCPSCPAPESPATPEPVLLEPARPFLWQVCDKVRARIAGRKESANA